MLSFTFVIRLILLIFLQPITENNDDITPLLFAVIVGSSFPCLKILIQVDNLIWRMKHLCFFHTLSLLHIVVCAIGTRTKHIWIKTIYISCAPSMSCLYHYNANYYVFLPAGRAEMSLHFTLLICCSVHLLIPPLSVVPSLLENNLTIRNIGRCKPKYESWWSNPITCCRRERKYWSNQTPSRSIEVIRLLLEAGADPNTCSDVSCIFHVN
jgi:hypothetical protein